MADVMLVKSPRFAFGNMPMQGYTTETEFFAAMARYGQTVYYEGSPVLGKVENWFYAEGIRHVYPRN